MPGPGFGFFEAQRASSQDATRPSDRVAIASVLLGGIIVGVILVVQLSADRPTAPQLFGATTTTQAPHVQSGHLPTPAEAGALTVATVVRPAPPAPLTAEQSSRRQVAHTDGEGVVLRASPRDNDWTPRGFMDGEWVTVIDQSRPEWVMVQGDNGEQGWVPAQYLTP